jgi:hypothetical protein
VAFRLTLDHPFAGIIIRSVLVCYGTWGVVAIGDLVGCEMRRAGQCEAQRSEIRGAATAIPATLLAWLADSPVSGKPIKPQPQTTTRPRSQP